MADPSEITTLTDFFAAYDKEADGDMGWRSTRISPEVCLALLRDGFNPESLLLNKKLPSEVLAILAAHSDPRIRSMVADKRSAGPLLQTLASDPDVAVRLRVAWNAKVPLALLTTMLDDPAPEVRETARLRLARLGE